MTSKGRPCHLVFAVGAFLFHALFNVIPEGLLSGVEGFPQGCSGFFVESVESGVEWVAAFAAGGFDHGFVEFPDLRGPSAAFAFVSCALANVGGGGVEGGVKESLPCRSGEVLSDGAVVEFGDEDAAVVGADRVPHELEGVQGT